MISRSAGFFALALLMMAPTAVSQAQTSNPDKGNLTLVLGVRDLDDEQFWAPAHNQEMVEVEHLDFAVANSGLGMELGLYVSHDEERIILPGPTQLRANSTVYDGFLGVRKSFAIDDNPTRFFLAGGLAVLSGEYEVKAGGVAVDESDFGFGVYIHSGLYWRLGRHFNLGIDVRALLASDLEMKNFGQDADVDGLQYGMSLGWGW